MTALVAGAAGLALGGPWIGMGAIGLALLAKWRRPEAPESSLRPILLILLVELRSGRSILSGLQQAALAFPDHDDLVRGTRTAMVGGLTAAVEHISGDIRRLFAQLARAQRSGAPVAGAIRSMLEADITAERSRRLARAKALPVRLMIPVALLLLPGLVLLLYAPSLLRLLDEMTEPFT